MEHADLLQRLNELEERVAKLEGNAPPIAVEGADGSVLFAGDVDVADQHFVYQWERPTGFLLGGSWEPHVDRLAALAHPVRAEILRHLLAGAATVTDLVEAGIATSTGTGYHHLTSLTSAGWVAKTARGSFEVRPSRVVPLLAIIAAAEDH